MEADTYSDKTQQYRGFTCVSAIHLARVAITLTDPRVSISARGNGAVTPSAGAVAFTATPLPGQEPPTSVINQPILFVDYWEMPGHVMGKLG